jgi:hypothetical protein
VLKKGDATAEREGSNIRYDDFIAAVHRDPGDTAAR